MGFGVGFGTGVGDGAKAGFSGGADNTGGGDAVIVFSGDRGAVGAVSGVVSGVLVAGVFAGVFGVALDAASTAGLAGFVDGSIPSLTGGGAGGGFADSGSGDSRIHNATPAVAMTAIARRVAGRRVPRRWTARPSSSVMPVSVGQVAGKSDVTHFPSCLPECCTARCRRSYQVHAAAGNRTVFRRLFLRPCSYFRSVLQVFWCRPGFRGRREDLLPAA